MRSRFTLQRGGAVVAMVAATAAASAVTTALTVVIGATAAAVVGAGVGLLVSRVTSQILGGGDQRPQQSSTLVQARDTGQTINVKGTDEPIPVAIGYCTNVSCLVPFKETIGDYFYMACVVSEGEIAGFDACYLDGTISTDSKFAGLVTIEYHVGTDTQPVSALLRADMPTKWDTTDIGAGVAYAVLKLKRDNNAFPRGEPLVTFDIRGIKMKDTRDGVTRFTNNPALAIREFWTNTRWGKRTPTANVNDTRISDEANYFDARESVPATALTFTVDSSTDLVTWSAAAPFGNGEGVTLSTTGTLPGGLTATKLYYIRKGEKTGKFASSYANSLAGTAIDITTAGSGTHTGTHTDQPRYTCNGMLDPSLNAFDNLPKLRSSCRSYFFEAGGQWHLICDKPVAGPYKAVTKDHFVGEMTGDLGGEDGRYNRVVAEFVNPFLSTKPDFATSSNSSELTDDGGRLLQGRLKLPFTDNPYMAQRLAQIERRASRLSLRVTGTLTVAGLQHFPGDVIEMTHDTPGFVAKLFRVINIKPKTNDEMLFEFAEYADSVWTLDAASAMAIPVRTNLTAVVNVTQDRPPDISGLEILGQGNDTTFTGPNCRVTWREASRTGGINDWWRSYVVRMYVGGVLKRTEYPTTNFYTYRLDDNKDDNGGTPVRLFTFSVKNLTRHRPGLESANEAIITVENPAPVVTGFTMTAGIYGFGFDYTVSADTDFVGIEVWASTVSGFTPDDSVLVYKGNSTKRQVAGLSPGLKYYVRYRPYDAFGAGDLSAEVAVTTFSEPHSPLQAALSGSGYISFVSTITPAVTELVSEEAKALYCPTNGLLYVIGQDYSANTFLYGYDLSTDTLVQTIDLSATYVALGSIIWCPLNQKIYVAAGKYTDASLDDWYGWLLEIDPATGNVDAVIQTGDGTCPVWNAGVFNPQTSEMNFIISDKARTATSFKMASLDPVTRVVTVTAMTITGALGPTSTKLFRAIWVPSVSLIYFYNNTGSGLTRGLWKLDPTTGNCSRLDSTASRLAPLYCPQTDRVYRGNVSTAEVTAFDPMSETITDTFTPPGTSAGVVQWIGEMGLLMMTSGAGGGTNYVHAFQPTAKRFIATTQLTYLAPAVQYCPAQRKLALYWQNITTYAM